MTPSLGVFGDLSDLYAFFGLPQRRCDLLFRPRSVSSKSFSGNFKPA
jgi:hypothetical protein